MKICNADDCSSKHYGRGYCKKHYSRLISNGNPYVVRTSKRHGKTDTSEHYAWRNMKARCYYKKHPQYKDYGGRGIKVCEKWLLSFESFYKDMGDKPTAGHTLDRIDNDGDYAPSNCRWATRLVQNNNQRIRKDNTSGVKGVSWNKQKQAWVVQKGHKRYIGTYKHLKDAVNASKEVTYA